MEDPLESGNKTHCRFCAEEKNYGEVLDLQGDIKTFEEYLKILEYLKVDYLDLSDSNRLPKTTCEKCYDGFQEAYKFFTILDHIQSVLKTSYDINVKREPADLKSAKSEKQHQENTESDVQNCPDDFISGPSHLENKTQDCKGPSSEDNSKTKPQYSIAFSDNDKKISQCRFCAGHKSSKDMVHLSGETTIKEYRKIMSFFKIGYLNLDQAKLPKTSCELCYNSLLKVHKFLRNVRNSQIILNSLYNVKTEPGHNHIKIKIDEYNNMESEDLNMSSTNTQETNVVPLSILSLNYSSEVDKSWANYLYICCHCQVVYESIDELRSHSKEKHSMCYALRCADCNEKFCGFSDFIEHVRQHREVLRLYCQYCNAQFETAAQCTDHVNTHYIGTQKICELCGEMLPYTNTLDWHRKLYGQPSKEVQRDNGKSWLDYEWVCQDCSLRLPDVASLRTHTQKAHDKCFAMRCMDCSKVLKNYKLFVAHAVEHRPYLKNFCQYCNSHYDDIAELNQHRVQHITSQQRPCANCGQIFKDNTQLAKHKNTFKNATTKPKTTVKRRKISTKRRVTKKSTNKTTKRKRVVRKGSLSTEDLTCTVCQKLFDSLAKLSRHLKTHDGTRPRDFVCPTCGKTFLTNTTMRDHAKTHSVRTEVCQVCQKEFHTKHQLKAHIITHSEVRPFICDECGNSFKTKKRLKCHLKTHSNVKPYKCLYCFKEFKFKENLKTHEHQHTGLRPYSCEMCERTFTNWTNCNKHMIRKHGVTLARTKITAQGRVAIDRKTGEIKSIASDKKTKDWLDQMMKPEKRGRRTTQ